MHLFVRVEENSDKIKGERAYIVGFFNDSEDELEGKFWDDESFPYLFITSISTRKTLNTTSFSSVLSDSLTDGSVSIMYNTLDGGDVLVCLKTKFYHFGFKHIKEFDALLRLSNPNNQILHSSTTVLFDSRAANVDNEETVNILMRCQVSDYKEYEKFVRKLKTDYGEEKVSDYGVLGIDDRIIHVDGLSTKDWRSIYVGENAVLTAAKIKKHGLYSIRTEILEEKK